MKRILLCVIAAVCTLHAQTNNDKPELPRVMVVLDERIDNTDAIDHRDATTIIRNEFSLSIAMTPTQNSNAMRVNFSGKISSVLSIADIL